MRYTHNILREGLTHLGARCRMYSSWMALASSGSVSMGTVLKR